MPATPQIPKVIFLTIDGDDHSLDVLDAGVVPTPGPVQRVTTLDGETHQDIGATTWSLDLRIVLDWSSSRPGLAYRLMDQAGEAVAFVLNVHADSATGSAAEPPVSGTCTLVPVPYGGTGNEFVEATVSLPIDGTPVWDITP